MGKKALKRIAGRTAKKRAEKEEKKEISADVSDTPSEMEHWETRVALGVNGLIKSITVANMKTGSASTANASNNRDCTPGAKERSKATTSSSGKVQQTDGLDDEENSKGKDHDENVVDVDGEGVVVTKEIDAKGYFVYRLLHSKMIMAGNLAVMDFKIFGKDEDRVIFYVNYFYQETLKRKAYFKKKAEIARQTESDIQKSKNEPQGKGKISEIQYAGWKKLFKILPLVEATSFEFVMDMDPEYLTGEDVGGPTKVEMDQFLKKFKMLTKAELEAALRVSPEDFVSVLNQMVPCVGCRRSAEAVFQQYQDGPNYGFYPLCMDEKGMMFLAKDKITPKFLCTMFHCPSLKVQNLIDSLSKCKSGRRCALHSLESQRIRTVSSWVDVWDYMDEKCQQRTVMVDAKCLIDTLERYLKKHRFCTECKSKVLRAYNILTGELDPASEPGFIAQLYDGIECCKEDQHLHLMCKTEFVSRLIAKAVPELVGSSRRERHAKTMEIAQEEVLTCLGLCVFERLHRIQQRFREEERTWEIIMCTAIQALRRSFEVAVENKLGVSQLELLCQELNKEELAKQQRKERKKLNRKRKKEKKSEESADTLVEDAADEVEETLEETAEPFTEVEIEEAQEQQKDSCHCEPVETAPSKSRKKKSGKGKNKTNASSELPLSNVNNGAVKKSETGAQKGSATSLCQELRCSSETSRDCGYSSESTSINHDNTTCSSLEGSEIACAEDCCRLCPDYITSDAEPRIVQGPYRSLLEQLEDEASDEEEDNNWVPPEISAIKSESWGQEREQFRETLKLKFHEMLSKRKPGCVRRVGCNDPNHASDRLCTDCCERDENSAPAKSSNDGTAQKDGDATAVRKSSRSGNQGGSNKGNRSGGHNNRKYKGKNRR